MAVAIVTVTVVSAQENDKEDMMVIPVKVIRFHLFPQNLYGVVQFPQVR